MIYDLASYRCVAAPPSTSRIIPSRFPPVPAFDTVVQAEDLALIFELEGWTNDRLVADRLKQLPESEWAFGRPNSSIIMASFLHGSPSGLRFTSLMGAWYASSDLRTAILEVANGIRKELSLTGLTHKFETYREYKARLVGDFVDIFGLHPEFHDPDDATYPTPQAFGEQVRAAAFVGGASGLRYESTRHPDHENWVCFLPNSVLDVLQADHFELSVGLTGKVAVKKLS